MTRNFSVALKRLFLLAILCFYWPAVTAQKLYAKVNTHADLQAEQTKDNPVKRSSRSLRNVLLDLEKAYKVSFNFNDDALRKVRVPADFTWNTTDNLEAVLNRLIPKETQLTYKVIDKNNYLILAEKPQKQALLLQNEGRRADELPVPARADVPSVSSLPIDSKTPELAPTVIEFKVRGRVTSDNGEGLPGASVLVKGSSVGTTTDVEGNFMISANSGSDVLVFSYIGFLPKEVPINNQSVINIKLSNDEKLLNEVVVVGYGTQKRKDLTSSIGIVDAAVIANQSVGNAMAAIQGRLAGVQITNNGRPGSAPSIRIRGTGSIYNSSPLYVVDGIIVNDITYLGPNDIDNITVLRDASASAIYGVQAANGVILITTKKGANDGKVRVSVNSYIGSKQPSKIMDMASTSEWVTMYNERMLYSGTPDKQLDPTKFPTSTAWFNEILRPSTTTNNDVNIQGGNKQSSFNIGVNMRLVSIWFSIN